MDMKEFIKLMRDNGMLSQYSDSPKLGGISLQDLVNVFNAGIECAAWKIDKNLKGEVINKLTISDLREIQESMRLSKVK